MASDNSWTTIESDPGVFTELMEKMGAKGVEVAELWSCDRESMAQLEPIYGLIFLFKYQKETDDRPVDKDFASKGIFFANQVINNACATQAIISVLMNVQQSQHPGFDLGTELTTLRDFTAKFPPDLRGLAIGNSDAIRTVHNSFTPPQPLVPEEKDDEKGGEAFHFVAYVPAAGGVYELDGLKPGPIRLCDCPQEEWLGRASEALTARIAKYAASEQRFNLMALVRSKKDVYQERLQSCQETAEALHAQQVAGDAGAAASELQNIKSEIRELGAALAAEEEKRRRWNDENLRRRTDFTPFTFQLLTALAMKGELPALVAAAEEDQKQRRASANNKNS